MPKSYERVEKIRTITLDDYVSKNNIQKIKLLKLEGEGFEPEILEGAVKAVNLIEFIAVDGAYERGVNKEETLSFACNFLLASSSSFPVNGRDFVPSINVHFPLL